MFQSFKFSHKLKNAFHQPKCWSTSWMTKSHSCGRLTSEDLGKRVTVAGWLQFKRKGEKLLNTWLWFYKIFIEINKRYPFCRLEKFLVLRDTHGLVQLMISNNSIWSKLGDISLESVLQVTGVVVRRPENQVNPNMTSGEIEVKFSSKRGCFAKIQDCWFLLLQIEVDSVDWVNPAPKNIPFYIKDFNEGKEPLRMQVVTNKIFFILVSKKLQFVINFVSIDILTSGGRLFNPTLNFVQMLSWKWETFLPKMSLSM